MILVIINAIVSIASLIGVIFNYLNDNFKWTAILSLCMFTNTMCFFINLDKVYNKTDSIEMSKPTAKDVYDGKTTLRIVYEDSIPVDTIVVFKKEFR